MRKALDGLAACDWSYETDAAAAERRLAEEWFDALVVAIGSPNGSGLGLVEKIRRRDRSLPLVVVSSTATVDTATAALRLGAADYLTQPLRAASWPRRFLDRSSCAALMPSANCSAVRWNAPTALTTSRAPARPCAACTS